MKYIHYGSDKFHKDRFGDILNGGVKWNKPEPYSGLWASPIDSERNWKNWGIDNNFRVGNLYSSFTFELKSDSNIITIKNDDDIDRYLSNGIILKHHDLCYFDFEKLKSDGLDAIVAYINTPIINQCLYGWDCDSILVLNSECVIPID